MRKFTFLFISILGLVYPASAQFGKIVVSPQNIYEDINSYHPHDYFLEEKLTEFTDYVLKYSKEDGIHHIENIFWDGYMGHEVKISFNSELDIIQVEYDEIHTFEDGSETSYKVENIIFSANQSPTDSENLVGHYTLIIKSIYEAGEIQSNEGGRDTIEYYIFNGKFKFYSENEKLKGKEWVLDQNEIKQGIKDSLGFYLSPDEFAKFKGGDDELRKLLRNYAIQRNETNHLRKGIAVVSMIINDDGSVDPNSLVIHDEMWPKRILSELKADTDLMNNWIPAKYKCKNVKSEVNLPIRVYE